MALYCTVLGAQSTFSGRLNEQLTTTLLVDCAKGSDEAILTNLEQHGNWYPSLAQRPVVAGLLQLLLHQCRYNHLQRWLYKISYHVKSEKSI